MVSSLQTTKMIFIMAQQHYALEIPVSRGDTH